MFWNGVLEMENGEWRMGKEGTEELWSRCTYNIKISIAMLAAVSLQVTPL